jgi:hypothetical protein
MSNSSFEDYEDGDSMASSKREGKEQKDDMGLGSSQASGLLRSIIGIPSKASDAVNVLKGAAGLRTKTLCTTCKNIPFAECLPGDTEEDGEAADRINPAQDPLISYLSLSRILEHRKFCKFCDLLFQTVCEPEYDLLKAQHIEEYLPKSGKYKDLRNFPGWIKRNTYLKREWVGGAGMWPFGYATDEQAASSTLQQAKTLFLEAEDRDINTKSLNMNDLRNMYDSDAGRPYYHNEGTTDVTWTRPTSPIRLTSTNKFALSKEHSLEAESVHIPKTIKDAIEVVQAIGERYMWVDQLCVPQEGDEHVMHANIQRMGHVYNRALFTIVAGDSSHADEGLRGLHGHPSRGKQLVKDDIIENTRMVLPTRMELKYGAWEERAWCLQEKLLSRRMLIFAGGFAVWHCRGGTWREDVNALDGDKSLISFPWLRLTPLPHPSHDISPAGLQIAREDGSVRLMRLPSIHQYIDAVEDLGTRTIGKSCDILSAFNGLANVLCGPVFLNSPFRNGLPCHFLDVALLWQSDEPMRRRQDDFNRKCPPSWTWAGWEAAQALFVSGSKGARIRYDQPFDVLVLDSGIVRRYRRCGEERIRPRKGTLYGIQKKRHGLSLQELGLFGMSNMSARGFRDWDSADARPAPKPRLDIPLEKLTEQHLIMNTELVDLNLGSDCWKVRTSTKRAGDEDCIIEFHDTKPTETTSKAEEVTQPDLQIKTVVFREHWINTATNLKAGTVKFDTGFDEHRANPVTAILLSEAQYLGNETRPDVLGYPLYNIILVKTVRVEGGVKFMERIGLGRIYKYAWREAGARKEVVVLE